MFILHVTTVYIQQLINMLILRKICVTFYLTFRTAQFYVTINDDGLQNCHKIIIVPVSLVLQ